MIPFKKQTYKKTQKPSKSCLSLIKKPTKDAKLENEIWRDNAIQLSMRRSPGTDVDAYALDLPQGRTVEPEDAHQALQLGRSFGRIFSLAGLFDGFRMKPRLPKEAQIKRWVPWNVVGIRRMILRKCCSQKRMRSAKTNQSVSYIVTLLEKVWCAGKFESGNL